jgi:hypothetical protein
MSGGAQISHFFDRAYGISIDYSASVMLWCTHPYACGRRRRRRRRRRTDSEV